MTFARFTLVLCAIGPLNRCCHKMRICRVVVTRSVQESICCVRLHSAPGSLPGDWQCGNRDRIIVVWQFPFPESTGISRRLRFTIATRDLQAFCNSPGRRLYRSLGECVTRDNYLAPLWPSSVVLPFGVRSLKL